MSLLKIVPLTSKHLHGHSADCQGTFTRALFREWQVLLMKSLQILQNNTLWDARMHKVGLGFVCLKPRRHQAMLSPFSKNTLHYLLSIKHLHLGENSRYLVLEIKLVGGTHIPQ